MNSARGLMLIMLISHFLGDYYLQTNKMAASKADKPKDLLLHTIIHLMLGVALLYITYGADLLIIPLIVSVVHIVIDFIKGKFSLKYQNAVFKIYALDQLLHIISIVVAIYVFSNNPVFNTDIINLLRGFSIDPVSLNEKLLAIIILIKPASISVSLFLESFNFKYLNAESESNAEKGESVGLKNAGSTIGILERLIIYSLAAVGQYAAIGFILTAKSITRYEKISKDPAFGEYYLIGTLFSLLLVIPVALIL